MNQSRVFIVQYPFVLLFYVSCLEVGFLVPQMTPSMVFVIGFCTNFFGKDLNTFSVTFH